MSRGLKLWLGIPLTVIGFFMTLGGIAVVTLVGSDGTFGLPETAARSSGHALIFDAIAIRGDLPETGSVATTIDIDIAGSGVPVFVGVGPTGSVAQYLADVRADRIVQVNWPGGMRTEEVEGTAQPEPPGDQGFWVVSDEGDDAHVSWVLDGGDWSVVVMNADASSDVDVQVEAAVSLPILGPVGIGILVVGLGALVGGALLTISGAKTPKQGPSSAPPTPPVPLGPTDGLPAPPPP